MRSKVLGGGRAIGFRFLIAGLAITGLAVITSKTQETTNLREVY
ncbi:hypothetical protein AVDCRST_MAG84-4815 [uncultured Microcoleus sp.]|uniref:Uncharacterized protein n=1 Tax=uncultured Microcoleus sp. TaxID=259945 RepID=A0A6J4N472_9CYAN|nr:hypothetical protein AVDCRST_MAG84-4815 [uncultured Microcoleus sp.]